MDLEAVLSIISILISYGEFGDMYGEGSFLEDFLGLKSLLFYLSKLTATLSKLGEGGIQYSQVFTIL